MAKYAKDTTVTTAASKAEIERIVERYGASGFMSGWSGDNAVLAFKTVAETVKPGIEQAYLDGKLQPLLPDYTN
jgi:hypothetical protein